MDNQKNLDEKLSELFDGELDPFEIPKVLESISSSKPKLSLSIFENLSFNSIIILFAVFKPTPGIEVNAFTSPDIIFIFNFSGARPLIIVSPSFGPIPLMEINIKNKPLSDSFSNPYKSKASSLTWR